ncbi:hypothetical protein MP228_000356 [Amoeboaphelidium protococcarum]|nr:hypothetical protein MP228_000356 [Amoeboaphelidium protococcarum]
MLSHNKGEQIVDGESAEESPSFNLSIGQLQELFDPKDVKKLRALDGINGLCRALRTNLFSGLDKDGDYKDRTEFYGANRLPEQPPKTLLQLFLLALRDKTLIVLTVASLVSLAIGLYLEFRPSNDSEEPHWVEGVAIIASVIVVALVQSINDYKKEAQFRQLNTKKEDREVKCLRSGNVQMLSIFDVVVGDILLLEPGDIVNVDGVMVSGHNLHCDESSATGESDLIRKTPYSAYADGADFDPFILSGSKVTEGVGQFLVTCVGEYSFNGKLMMGLRIPEDDTPLQVKLDGLAETIAKTAVSVSLLLLVILVIKYLVSQSINGWDEGPIILETIVGIVVGSIVIIVVAVPEGLPLAVTIALAYGITKMMKDNNLVRVLSACETMGNATTICSDKTGTLTQNRMTVVAGFIGCRTEFKNDSGIAKLKKKLTENQADIMDKRHKQLMKNPFTGVQYTNLLLDAILMNSSVFEEKREDGSSAYVGNKTECALLDFCDKLGLYDYTSLKKDADSSILQVYPFSSLRKSMITVIKLDDNTVRFYIKGASEIVLGYSDKVMVYNQAHNNFQSSQLSDQYKVQLQEKISKFANDSLRTIIIAYKDMTMGEYKDIVGAENVGKEIPEDAAARLEAHLQSKYCIIALVGIEDPLRDGVADAVRKCQLAGVVVRMVTGDNVNTARAIAAKCGIYTQGGIVMEGPQFRNLPDKEMKEMLPRLQVLARSSPGDKQILVGKLKEMGETVAVTGDGTNDAPALKMADVGFSMGITGTEVCKEASSIILMDDNFASILKAMMWGRSVFDSVRKFIQFQLTSCISAVIIVFVSAVASPNNKAIMSAVQLLWVNMIMCSQASLSLSTDRPNEDILDRMPDSRKDPLITVEMWKLILGMSSYIVCSCLFLVFLGPVIFRLDLSRKNDYIQLSTLVFNVFIFELLLNEFNCRRIDGKFNIFKGILQNKFFIPLFLLAVPIQVIIVYFGGAVFTTTPLTGAMWGTTILCGLLVFPMAVILRLFPTGDGCKICGFNFGMKDTSRSSQEDLSPSQQALNAIVPVAQAHKKRLSLYKAIHSEERYNVNAFEPDAEEGGMRNRSLSRGSQDIQMRAFGKKSSSPQVQSGTLNRVDEHDGIVAPHEKSQMQHSRGRGFDDELLE